MLYDYDALELVLAALPIASVGRLRRCSQAARAAANHPELEWLRNAHAAGGWFNELPVLACKSSRPVAAAWAAPMCRECRLASPRNGLIHTLRAGACPLSFLVECHSNIGVALPHAAAHCRTDFLDWMVARDPGWTNPALAHSAAAWGTAATVDWLRARGMPLTADLALLAASDNLSPGALRRLLELGCPRPSELEAHVIARGDVATLDWMVQRGWAQARIGPEDREALGLMMQHEDLAMADFLLSRMDSWDEEWVWETIVACGSRDVAKLAAIRSGQSYQELLHWVGEAVHDDNPVAAVGLLVQLGHDAGEADEIVALLQYHGPDLPVHTAVDMVDEW